MPVEGIAKFVKNLLSRPILQEGDDEKAEIRFYNSLIRNLKKYADEPDHTKIREEKFCELMKTFNPQSSRELTDEQ